MAEMIRTKSLMKFVKEELVKIDNERKQLIFEKNTSRITLDDFNLKLNRLYGRFEFVLSMASNYGFYYSTEFNLIMDSVNLNLVESMFPDKEMELDK